MFEAKIENYNGDVLTLTGNEPVYQILSITGLNPPTAQINLSNIAGLDGAVFNSSKLETRNIVLTIKINGNAEENRLNLYKYFQTKTACKFYYSNNSLDVWIAGYIESVECDLFSNAETAQISIICPYPYFQSISEILADSSGVLGAFTFPFSIDIGSPVIISEAGQDGVIAVYNAAESATPTTIEIDFKQSASSVELINTFNGDTFELDYSFLANDKVIINTQKGKKSVSLIRSGTIINLFSAVKKGSTFFQLMPGVNSIDYEVDGTLESGAVYIVFRYHNSYRGV